MNIQPSGLVEQTRDLLHAVRGSLIRVAQNLHLIKESNEWKNHSESWGTFCEETLQISQSQASKLLSINKHFIIEGGKDPLELEGTDYEKLYAATKLEGSVDEKLAKAQTLSRSELKQEKAEEAPHTPEWVTYCSVCRIAQGNHP